jgi:hypothetical protein
MRVKRVSGRALMGLIGFAIVSLIVAIGAFWDEPVTAFTAWSALVAIAMSIVGLSRLRGGNRV